MMWVEILSRHRDIAARFRITGTEARIGRGYDNDVIVEEERPHRRERRALAITAAAALAALIITISALDVWLAQTSEPRISSYLTPALSLVATLLIWIGGWALVSRLFAGRLLFVRHLL